MNCMALFVMVAGLSINPCHVTDLEDYTSNYDGPYCIITFDTGNAWDGQHRQSVPGNCASIQQAINNAIKESK